MCVFHSIDFPRKMYHISENSKAKKVELRQDNGISLTSNGQRVGNNWHPRTGVRPSAHHWRFLSCLHLALFFFHSVSIRYGYRSSVEKSQWNKSRSLNSAHHLYLHNAATNSSVLKVLTGLYHNSQHTRSSILIDICFIPGHKWTLGRFNFGFDQCNAGGFRFYPSWNVNLPFWFATSLRILVIIFG